MPSQDPLLKTQQVALAFGVSVSTIKRWVDAGVLGATRTVGMHRLIRLSEALRFARSQGLSVAGLDAFETRVVFPVGSLDEALCESLTDSLRQGDAQRSRALITSTYATGCGAAALADQLIRPAMERIGHGWMVGTLDVYQEHQASQFLASALVELNDEWARSTRPGASVAVGATSEGDAYVLPLLLGELALRELGWDVRNLGVNLPLRSLANAVLAFQPRLVFLSVNYLTDPERFCREYLAYYERTAPVGAAVVIGGRALGPDLRARLVYASFGERMAHLSEFARRLVPDPTFQAAEAPSAFDGIAILEQPGSAIS